MIRGFTKRSLIKAYQWFANTPEGKLVLHDLMRNSFIFRPTSVPGDERQSWINEGKREFALRILFFLKQEKNLAQLSQEAEQYQIVMENDNDR